MNEHTVWKSVIRYSQEEGWDIICACPPGATCYGYPACMFASETDGIDSPDIVFLRDKILVVIECKPNLSQINRKNKFSENDINKLKRIKKNLLEGQYNDQLISNYKIELESLNGIEIAIAYSGANLSSDNEVSHFLVCNRSLAVSYIAGIITLFR